MESPRSVPATGLWMALVLAIGWHATCITCGQYKADVAPLKIELPPKVYTGTQPNIAKIANLEKMRSKPRLAFYAPVGVTNVALGRPVTASDDIPMVGELEMITDGDKRAQDGSFVEIGPFLQHVTIDLETPCDIYAVVVWHWHMQSRVYWDVVLQIADDPDFIENVHTLFNNDIDNSAGLGVGKDKHYVETHEGRLIDAKGCRGRYVRLYSQGNEANGLNHYTEVEVWGSPVADRQHAIRHERIKQLMDFLASDRPWGGVGSLSAKTESERRAEIAAMQAEAIRELVFVQDEFVDILVEQLQTTENTSELLTRAVLPALRQIENEKARAVLLSLAFYEFNSFNRPRHSLKWYYSRLSNASEAQELLNNADPHVILRALETMGRLDPVLMEHVRRLLQGEYRIMAAERLAKIADPAEGVMVLDEILASVATVDELPKAQNTDVWGNPDWLADTVAEKLVAAIGKVAVEDDALLSLVGPLSGRRKWCVVLALAQRGNETVRPELEGMVRDDSLPANFRWAAFRLFCSGAGERDRGLLKTVAETDSTRVYPQNQYATYPFRVLAKHTLRRLDRARRAISEEGLVRLPVEIPPPMHFDWPSRVMPLLTEDIPTRLPELLAPPGVANMALGAPVTSSDDLPIIGDLPQVVDGDKTSRDGTYLELGPGPQWIVIDLQRPCEVYWIGLWHYQYRVYFDVVVQVSGDPDFVDCVTLFNNDHDGSGEFGEGIDLLYQETHIGKWIEGQGVRGRYVMLYSNGNTANDLNQYCEVEVWGRPVD